MSRLDIRPLTPDHSFGARISGITWETVEDEAVRQQVRDCFEVSGVIIFEDIEPSTEMQVAVSKIFGPLRDHVIKNMNRIDAPNVPGLVSIGSRPGEGTIVEVGGKQLADYVPWHFDACYTEQLNRAGLLQIVEQSADGGETGFADGVQIYNALSPEWREIAEGLEVIYFQGNMHHNQRYGLADDFRLIQLMDSSKRVIEEAKSLPRAVHPAVWQREKTGEKVFHVSPWQADGIYGRENEEGDAQLEELIGQMHAVVQPYWHHWQPNEMAIWDNWRCVHSAGGHDPAYARDAHRTTILGDYGLGRFENSRRPAPG
ncbi:MAG: TauD/TfdA family dioxygenase [Novosphingobium sp.]|nr:TauD/TfdA family dioxygenase [Novosphingobium sp.]